MRRRLLLGFSIGVVTVFGISCKVLPREKQDIYSDTSIKLNRSSFFPISMYTWCPDIITDSSNTELDILKSAGFNLIDVKFRDTSKNKYLGFMERCKLRGINLLIEGNTEEATRGSNDPLFFK